MYYLTYRPQSLQELDNSSVREKIQHVLTSNQVPHAFLLVGQKGMGKTSTARIMAKAMNCSNTRFSKKTSNIQPCNSCDNCVAITKGQSPDVVEQDAASNRGIDEIRKLIGEVYFAPMMGKKRVYIIDEAHMITPDAFNALLKTLEEPPEHVVFILATTNEEKLPKTIISRCVRIPFGRAEKKDILHMIDRISEGEHLSVPTEVSKLIAVSSDYSFRDASKLLEELVTQNKLSLEDAKQYIGLHGQKSLLEILVQKDWKESLLWVEQFVENGGNVRYEIESMLLSLKQQLLLKSGIDVDEADLGFSKNEIVLLMKLLHDSLDLVRVSPVPAIPLELVVADFYNKSTVK